MHWLTKVLRILSPLFIIEIITVMLIQKLYMVYDFYRKFYIFSPQKKKKEAVPETNWATKKATPRA